MAGVKISNLPAATTPLSGTESVPIVQGGVTVKVAASNFGGSFNIASLPAATTPLSGTESVPILQGGVTSKVSAADISSTVFYTANDPNAVTRTLSSKLGELLTPQDFGAIGDGVVDDTTAWSYWQAAPGNKYLPVGSYLVYGVTQNILVGTFINTFADNHAAGSDALTSIVSGVNNTAFGQSAGQSIDYGSGNVVVGYQAAQSLTNGLNNTAIGTRALYESINSSYSVAIGRLALSKNNVDYNVAVGANASILTTASGNTSVGYNALSACTTGADNTAVGIYALDSLVTFNNCTGLGNFSQVTGSSQVQLGSSGTTTYAYGAVQNRSDARDKADVRDTTLGLNFINALRPVDFKWDYREDYGWGEKDGSKIRKRFHHGLIAQEVKAACDAAEVDFGGLQDHAINGGKDVMSIGYEELIAPMIKSIQELTVLTESLKAQIQQLNAARNLQ